MSEMSTTWAKECGFAPIVSGDIDMNDETTEIDQDVESCMAVIFQSHGSLVIAKKHKPVIGDWQMRMQMFSDSLCLSRF